LRRQDEDRYDDAHDQDRRDRAPKEDRSLYQRGPWEFDGRLRMNSLLLPVEGNRGG
jgi:hypothetical protein